jgi:SWI/SNF-related matrix-associated actin-dependent regulator of chromatin subfamily A3
MMGMEQQNSHPTPSYRLAQSWSRGSRRSVNALLGDMTEDAPITGRAAFSGGILADDMGLGKTLEMISLILTDNKGGPTLIVAPKGVLSNWETQIQSHVHWKHALKVFRFHGPRCHATPDQLKRNDIVVTTYNKLGDEVEVEGPLRQVKWRRVILDEGHAIRNPESKAARAACMLWAKSRWVCTGTPM